MISVHILNNSLPYRSKKASFLVHAYLNEVILFYGWGPINWRKRRGCYRAQVQILCLRICDICTYILVGVGGGTYRRVLFGFWRRPKDNWWYCLACGVEKRYHKVTIRTDNVLTFHTGVTGRWSFDLALLSVRHPPLFAKHRHQKPPRS